MLGPDFHGSNRSVVGKDGVVNDVDIPVSIVRYQFLSLKIGELVSPVTASVRLLSLPPSLTEPIKFPGLSGRRESHLKHRMTSLHIAKSFSIGSIGITIKIKIQLGIGK